MEQGQTIGTLNTINFGVDLVVPHVLSTLFAACVLTGKGNLGSKGSLAPSDSSPYAVTSHLRFFAGAMESGLEGLEFRPRHYLVLFPLSSSL